MYTAQETKDIIIGLLKEKKTNTSKMLSDLGYNQSLLLDMSRKNSMLSSDKLGRIADYLNVSVDYLLGRTDNPEINK